MRPTAHRRRVTCYCHEIASLRAWPPWTTRLSPWENCLWLWREFSTPMASDERHPRIRQRHAMRTDVGVIRDHNEDTAYVDPAGDFFIVADGMGGHAAGEVASKMAVDAVTAALEGAREEVADFARAPSDAGRRALVSALENAVRQAHQSVFQRGAAESDKQGMGTTLDVVLVAGSEAFVAHVGDSRTYLVRDRRAAQI